MRKIRNYPIRNAIHCLVSVLFGSLLIYLSIDAESKWDIRDHATSEPTVHIKTAQAELTLLLSGEQIPNFSEFDVKQPKYRKKFQRVVDSTISINPAESEILQSRFAFNDPPIFYQSPHFYSQQHSFLHRLTYF